jgi:hypothetical protein
VGEIGKKYDLRKQINWFEKIREEGCGMEPAAAEQPRRRCQQIKPASGHKLMTMGRD